MNETSKIIHSNPIINSIGESEITGIESVNQLLAESDSELRFPDSVNSKRLLATKVGAVSFNTYY